MNQMRPVKRHESNGFSRANNKQPSGWHFSGEICGTDLVAAVVSSGLCLPVVMKASAAPKRSGDKGGSTGPPTRK